MEKLSQSLIEFTDSFQFLAEEVVTQVAELAETAGKWRMGWCLYNSRLEKCFIEWLEAEPRFMICWSQMLNFVHPWCKNVVWSVMGLNFVGK